MNDRYQVKLHSGGAWDVVDTRCVRGGRFVDMSIRSFIQQRDDTPGDAQARATTYANRLNNALDWTRNAVLADRVDRAEVAR